MQSRSRGTTWPKASMINCQGNMTVTRYPDITWNIKKNNDLCISLLLFHTVIVRTSSAYKLQRRSSWKPSEIWHKQKNWTKREKCFKLFESTETEDVSKCLRGVCSNKLIAVYFSLQSVQVLSVEHSVTIATSWGGYGGNDYGWHLWCSEELA